MARPRNGPSNTIVIKLGTSSIVHETTHQPLLSILSSIVETVVHLRSLGHKVVLVSSGAIGVGLKRMDMPHRPKSLSGKQALAAIGQGRLIALWDNLFGQLGQPIAQVLLTRGDISDRTRYLNAVNTFGELLSLGVVPIVNENDTVSVSEIKFGDNDTLSAITSSMLHADYLFLLTDVDGLYTSNPRKDPNAKAIQEVSSITAIRSQVSTTTLGSNLGTGGMETKLIAAEIATAAGVATIITSSKDPKNILKIIQYHNSLKSGTNTPISVPPSSRSSPVSSQTLLPPMSISDTATPESSTSTPMATTPAIQSIPSTPTFANSRPPHTLFIPSPAPLRDLKAWTSHTLYPSGAVIIDSGAHQVLSKRESGGRLLPAGVIGVKGAFASGMAVKICIRKKKGGVVEPEFAQEEEEVEVSEKPIFGTDTEPNTPALTGIESISSSISTLDGMLGGRLVGLDHQHQHGPSHLSREIKLEEEGGYDEVTPSVSLKVLPDDDKVLFTGSHHHLRDGKDEEEVEEWEIEEVGRGLANYNYAQIDRVKGLKSSYIAQLLGYADSEYVVENITIRVPP
ncbi:Aspartate/glutamate/uridylate kinase [Abortiporus biennis]|nr:Aspartate/glutamate/uridylate kinase [Abortiporus biennis]